MGGMGRVNTKVLQGLVAVITGGGSGIGAATAHRLRDDGARTAILDLAGALAGREADADLAMVCDVTSPRAVAETAAAVRSTFGRCDIVVNSAGVAPVGDALACTEAEWGEAFDVNVKGTWLVCQAFIPDIITSGGGAVVNVASAAALRPTPGMAAYAASKAAVVALTKSIALDYAKFGVRANALCPGAVDTPLHHRTLSRRQARGDIVLAADGSAVPTAAAGEMAEYVLLLVRPQSASMTGCAIAPDGGRVMH